MYTVQTLSIHIFSIISPAIKKSFHIHHLSEGKENTNMSNLQMGKSKH